VSRFLGAEPFCMTYGDGLADIRIDELVNFHRTHGKCATVTAVTPPGRYGALDVRSNRVEAFVEKPKGDGGRINGGFFVLDPIVLDLIKGDEVRWEVEPMEQLASNGELMAYQHDGFWQPMDTLRDKHNLESLWAQGQAPWKVWEQ